MAGQLINVYIKSLKVSMGQESECGLAEWSWVWVFQEVTLSILARAAGIHFEDASLSWLAHWCWLL